MSAFESQGLTRSILAIVVSEIGDKTFLTAAILAANRRRVTVFAGALCALGLMSFLSALMGTVLPQIMSKRLTTIIAAVLFEVFGIRMLKEAWDMKEGADKDALEEEMREVQESIEKQEGNVPTDDPLEMQPRQRPLTRSRSHAHTSSADLADLETEQGLPQFVNEQPRAPRALTHARHVLRNPMLSLKRASIGASGALNNLANLVFSRTFTETFILTFVAEWGDRSQIVTMALGAAHSVWLVTVGTTLGHACCSALAVIAGRWVSQHVSVRHVTFIGAFLFILFGFVYAREVYMGEA